MTFDDSYSISYFKQEVQKFVNERGWNKYHTPKNLTQAVQIEAAELSEIFLFKDYPLDQILSNIKLKEQISDEIADIYIYLISLVNCLNLDLTTIFNKKMEKNKSKYSIDEFNNGNYHKK
jgi:NTP pyrophosphatase (non-canonical NTP hydrolase)